MRSVFVIVLFAVTVTSLRMMSIESVSFSSSGMVICAHTKGAVVHINAHTKMVLSMYCEFLFFCYQRIIQFLEPLAQMFNCIMFSRKQGCNRNAGY